jgi:hypothetical protein
MARAASSKGRGKKPAKKKKAAARKTRPAKRARPLTDTSTQDAAADMIAGRALGGAVAITGAGSTAFAADVVTPAQEMLARLTELEAAVAELSPLQPIAGIGHNDPFPLDNQELEEIKRNIALLKAQPPVPANRNEATPSQPNSLISVSAFGRGSQNSWIRLLRNSRRKLASPRRKHSNGGWSVVD